MITLMKVCTLVDDTELVVVVEIVEGLTVLVAPKFVEVKAVEGTEDAVCPLLFRDFSALFKDTLDFSASVSALSTRDKREII